jgi:hypothetical protein
VEPIPDTNNIDLNSVVEHIPLCEEKFKLKLPAKNSVSWDGISTKVIKKISPYIILPLACLINQSFQEGKFPENLKLSLILLHYLRKMKDKTQVTTALSLSLRPSLKY